MKVLIIGLGSIAQKHISALRSIDKSVNLFALRSSSRSDNINGITNIYSYQDISNLNVDFIIVSNPTNNHFHTLNRLKEFKLPLFIEKPLFDNTGEIQDYLVKNIITANIPTYVACNLRFLDSLIEIKEIIKNERINEVNVYCGSYLPNWRPNVNYKIVYSANKEMGGGVHIDLIHELDYVFWIFGPPLYSSSFFRNNSSLNISAYDYANYLWEYDKFSVNIILNYYRKDSKRSLEIVCESGTYYIDLLYNNITFNSNIIFESTQRIKDTYYNQMAFFIQEVLHNKDNFNSIDQAYKLLKLCLRN